MSDWPLFATCCYSAYRPGLMVGIPVRSSAGRPRRLGYDLGGSLRALYPNPNTLRWPEADFTGEYFEKLDREGVAGIRRGALRIREAVGAGPDVPLVGLCFEELTRPGAWCHRRAFAAWWQARTGEFVPELGGQLAEERDGVTVLPCDDDPADLLT